MKSILTPYINFKDTTREAMEFYHSLFGGKLTITSYGEGGMAESHPGEEAKIMHSQLETDGGIVFMAADTPNSMEFKVGMNMNISLSGDNEAELTEWYTKLSAEGSIFMPLEKAPWGDMFGAFTDRYGVSWMVNIAGNAQQTS